MNFKKFSFLPLVLAASLQAQESAPGPASAEAVPQVASTTEVATVDSAKTSAVTATVQTPVVNQTQTQPEPVPAVDSTTTVTQADSSSAPSAKEQNVPEAAQPEKTEPTAIAAQATIDSVSTDSVTTTQAPATAEQQPAETQTASAIQDSTAIGSAVAADSAKTQTTILAAADSAKVAPSDAKNDSTVQKSQEKANLLNVLHGRAYNTVKNEAAGSTIFSNMAFPHKMAGTKAVYFEPIEQSAVVSFGNSNTYFIGFDNSDSLGILTVGMSLGKFGFSLDGSWGEKWEDIKTPDGAEQNTVNTYNSSGFGATASLKTSLVDIAVTGHFTKPDNETYIKQHVPYNELDPNSWSVDGGAFVSHSGKLISWTAGVEVLRHDFKVKTESRSYQVINGVNHLVTVKSSLSDTSSRFEITPSFNIGGTVLEAEDAKVYIGVNSHLPIATYDEIENVCDSHLRASAHVIPNIFGEVALSQYFMAFGGASFDWNILKYEENVTSYSVYTKESVSNKTIVNLGARVQYKRLAFEMAFTKQFLQNPFSGFAKTDGIMLDIGAFINF